MGRPARSAATDETALMRLPAQLLCYPMGTRTDCE
eukprot:COSAG02_NODE_55464_length_290_cov_1.068063_1_plen_34_part_01